jgi:hypothetical protein
VKSVVHGIFGALLVLVAAFLIIPQYSDYRAASETSAWLIASMPTAQAITDNILRQKTTSGAGIGVPKPAFQFHPPALVEVTPNGTMLSNTLLIGQPNQHKLCWFGRAAKFFKGHIAFVRSALAALAYHQEFARWFSPTRFNYRDKHRAKSLLVWRDR